MPLPLLKLIGESLPDLLTGLESLIAQTRKPYFPLQPPDPEAALNALLSTAFRRFPAYRPWNRSCLLYSALVGISSLSTVSVLSVTNPVALGTFPVAPSPGQFILLCSSVRL